ncbi:MAG: transcriptional regulator TrmB [Candidatus Paceibacter sp.]|jgi:sugar-specific transcriptional regulator TrmB|nr:transcriptional regulator TrmB [Candidatus Paceibacter sp.]
MNKALFEKLGLSANAREIYMTLLRMHRATIAELSRETGIHRPVIYRTLPDLIDKRLVSKVNVGKRTMFVAENPAILQSLVEDIKSELDESIPELARMFEGNQSKLDVRYVEGRKGIQKIYEDLVRRSKKNDVFYRYESPRDFRNQGRYFPTLYIKRATGANNELEKYVITNEDTLKNRRERLWRHTKAIAAETDPFDYNITQLIYKDTVAFIDFDTETATLIQNKRFADFQLRIFKTLFKKL